MSLDLAATHFDSQHIYRIEWQPGPHGYFEWCITRGYASVLESICCVMLYWYVVDRYLDGEFLFGVDGESVYRLTGAMIPQVRLG